MREIQDSDDEVDNLEANTPPRPQSIATAHERDKNVITQYHEARAGDHVTRDAELPPQEENGWQLHGTMREDYAHHDPMALFPEPSSTVANATQTQLRVLEAVGVPNPLDSSIDVDVPRNLLPPEPSVPWSEIMKFSPGDPNGSTDSFTGNGSTSERTSTAPVATTVEVEAAMSQRSRPGPTTLLKGSPLPHEDAKEANPSKSTGNSTEDAFITPLLTNLSTPLETNQSGSKQPGQSTHSQSIQLGLTVDYEDDLATDLPQEQYKPRPSRSRSLKTYTQDEIDYSVIPERARKSKRRKTTHVTSTANMLTTPQKVQQICDMGFTPTTTRNALEHNSGDVTSTVDWLVTNRIGEDELASHNTPNKTPVTSDPQDLVVDPEGFQAIMRNLNEYRKDGLATPQSFIDAPAAVSGAHAEIVDREFTGEEAEPVQVKSPKVQVVIQKKSPARTPRSSEPSQKKAKRRKTTLDQPEPESAAIVDITEAIVEKKRSRGRPKKAVEPSPSTNAIEHIPLQDDLETPQLESLQADELNLDFARADDTKSPPANGIAERTDEACSVPSGLHASSKIDNPPNAAQSSRQPSKTATPEPKGKVPYRVGLSKRARIAPLLRVLKK